jgi:molecular chaperone GrpE (heat shock protein)
MKKENDYEQSNAQQGLAIESPMVLIAEGLAQLIIRANRGILQEYAESIMPTLNLVSRIETRQQQSVYHLEAIRKDLDTFLTRSKLLEKMSLENQALTSQHYQDHVILPVARSIFPVFDIIHDARNAWDDDDSLAARQTIDFANAISAQLQQFLLIFGIEVISHEPNAAFEPKIMKPVKVQTTNIESLDRLVARSLQVGFRLDQHRLLRLETVSLYKYQPGKFKTTTIHERKEDDTRN